MNVIGLMSGTSADGIDAALVALNGQGDSLQWDVLDFVEIRFPDNVRRDILALGEVATARVDQVCRANVALGEWFADAALAVCESANVLPEEVDLIGSHGQTIHHLPELGSYAGKNVRATLQIGDPAVIAERTGITTVSDFRSRDMAAGGQGAPLVPLVDYLLFRSPISGRILLNIGGIANLTVLPAGCALDDVVAFDTGPGNMVIDGVVSRLTGGALAYDEGGEIGRSGRAIEPLLAKLMGNPYFGFGPPKSTGRELFGQRAIDRVLAWQDSLENLVATATAWTGRSIADAIEKFVLVSDQFSEVVVSGGGAKNPFLMELLKDEIAPIALRYIGDLGMKSEEKEAVAFALLAYEAMAGRQGNVPGATGASHPVVLGSITPGKDTKSGCLIGTKFVL